MARQRSSARPVTRRVLDAGLGLELVGRDHGAGVDLHDLAADIELAALFDQHLGFFAQLVFADGLRAFAGVEQRAGRQLEAADVLGRDGDGADVGIGALVDGDVSAAGGGAEQALEPVHGGGTGAAMGLRARWDAAAAMRGATACDGDRSGASLNRLQGCGRGFSCRRAPRCWGVERLISGSAASSAGCAAARWNAGISSSGSGLRMLVRRRREPRQIEAALLGGFGGFVRDCVD